MPLKDHYRTLGVSTSATPEEIKKAYRQLAHRHHPDKANNSSLAHEMFLDIQEAYNILSHPKKRKRYDEERFFSGLSSRRDPEQISGAWLLQQTAKLQAHMQQVDSYRMNHLALYEYLLLLLSNSHIALLKAEQHNETSVNIISMLLDATRLLRYEYFAAITDKLYLIAGQDATLRQMIQDEQVRRRKRARESRFTPWMVVALALLLCLFMYLYARKAL